MNSKEKPTNEMEEIRKNDVGTNNTVKEIVGRRNKEKIEKEEMKYFYCNYYYFTNRFRNSSFNMANK